MNTQLAQYAANINILISEREQARILLQTQSQLINEKDERIKDLQKENNRLVSEKQTRSQPNYELTNLQNENAELRRQISHLELIVISKDFELSTHRNEIQTQGNTISQQSHQLGLKDVQIMSLENRINVLESSLSQCQQEIRSKDGEISNLSIRLTNCVPENVNTKLQELSITLEAQNNEIKRCLEIISGLNAENRQYKILANLINELHNKYPKILPSFASELLQPGNESSSPDINNWARQQAPNIPPGNVLPLVAFRTQSLLNHIPVTMVNPTSLHDPVPGYTTQQSLQQLSFSPAPIIQSNTHPGIPH